MTPLRLLIASVSLLILSASSLISAQSNTSGITGTVTDPNGAVIPNATVVARNVETNARRTVTSNGEGFFSVPQLPPGKYEVTVTSTNFKNYLITNVNLSVGQTVRVDAALEVAGQTITEDLIGIPPMVD